MVGIALIINKAFQAFLHVQFNLVMMPFSGYKELESYQRKIVTLKPNLFSWLFKFAVFEELVLMFSVVVFFCFMFSSVETKIYPAHKC